MAATSATTTSSMSAPVLSGTSGGPPYQPYQCSVCGSRFTRHENLKRHAALHARPGKEGALLCTLCSATFARPDLRSRHMRRKHADHGSTWTTTQRIRRHTSTSAGKASPTADRQSTTLSQTSGEDECDGGDGGDGLHTMDQSTANAPASVFGSHNLLSDVSMGSLPMASSDVSHRVTTASSSAGGLEGADAFAAAAAAAATVSTASPSLSFDMSFLFEPNAAAGFNFDLSPLFQDTGWYPSPAQVDEGCSLFFTHVAFFVPILHQPTFDAGQAPRRLILAMLSLGYQYGEDPDCYHEQDSGVRLSMRCLQQALSLLAASSDNADPAAGEDSFVSTITTVQAYLLLQIHAMMYQCASDTAVDGLALHAKIVALARTSSLWQPHCSTVDGSTPAAGDLESLWRLAMRQESHKRTMFAVHQIDALWYQLLSVPRSVSHLEFKHSLPCPADDWAAPSSTAWAHRQLIAGFNQSAGGGGHAAMGYTEAVRLFLSPDDADRGALTAFDAYGALNIVQFLISSAREISGWSTMTGMLSVERIQPLKDSLLALRPYIHTSPQTSHDAATSPAALMCAATWEIAMIELQLWSPAHTRGLVGRTVRDVLLGKEDTDALHWPAAPAAFLYDVATAEAVRPHVDWFLHYLDAAQAPDLEAPWTTLYAYKAFLIAWQLMFSSSSSRLGGSEGGFQGAMQVVDVADGDLRGALRWARKVFQRRRRWPLGRLILRCLERLEQLEQP
ncbi:Transcription factor [Niveomyces insectorum RCEF 264]|uniref:Transcription factor n=1 Tax=Niveomyces insectorum RCEF 264 TaxID=1081102 RepID=A0A167X610_9HYPO|nr:Transcription factor [Niveomyces insectorum RCEF 264]